MSHIQKHEQGLQGLGEDQDLVGEHVPAPQEVVTPASSSSSATQGTLSSEASGSAHGQVEQAQSTPLSDVYSEAFFSTELQRKVRELVKFLSVKYVSNETVTEAEILKNVIKNFQGFYPMIFESACECMEVVFGIEVKEVDAANHSYTLLKILDLTYDGRVSNEEGIPKTGLLVLILGVIFMEGNRASEKKIWDVLSIVGIYPDKHDFICVNPRKLITQDLVKERYLEYQLVPGSNPPSYEFLWGPRAFAETTKMKVLQFFSKVSRSSTTAYTALYREALKDEEERARAAVASVGDPTVKDDASSGDKPCSFSK